MSNNQADGIKKLNEEYEDGLFRLAISDEAEKEGHLLTEENEQLKNDPEYALSQESIDRFERILKAKIKESKKKNKKIHFLKMFNKVAAVMFAVITVFSMTMMTVHAFRVHVLNFLINIKSNYTSFQINDDSKANSNNQRMDINWSNAYVPTYIPNGFEITGTSADEAMKKIIYTGIKDQALNVIYYEYSSSFSIAIDTENASLVKKIYINGNSGTLSVKKDIVTVVWEMDGLIFTVQGQLSSEEAIKLAESVKFKK